MNIILCIIGYFVVGFLAGFIICKIMGKEWCRDSTVAEEDVFSWKNNAEFIMFFSTFAWVLFILFSPFFILYYFITYTVKKLQE